MRKGHYTFMTLGLAGIIAVGGTGVLSQKISNAKTEEIVTTVKGSAEPSGQMGDAVKKSAETGGQIDDAAKRSADTGGQMGDAVKKSAGIGGQIDDAAKGDAALDSSKKHGDNWQEQGTEKQVFLKKYGVYLPESAEVKKGTKDSLKILWRGQEVTYYLSHSEKQLESDISLGDAVRIAIETVQKCGKQDATGKKIEISLKKNLLPEDADALLDKEEEDAVVNRKNYGVRYYAVDISGIKSHQYTLCINSVTGEVFGYVDYHDKGPDAEYGKEFGKEELEKLRPEFEALAEKFITEKLDLAGAKVHDFKVYDLEVDLMETEQACWEVFTVYCKTGEDDVIAVTFDPVEKSVQCFEVNPIF